MATHSSTLAWRIPWTEESDRLYSSWGCKELDMTGQLSLMLHVSYGLPTVLLQVFFTREPILTGYSLTGHC